MTQIVRILIVESILLHSRAIVYALGTRPTMIKLAEDYSEALQLLRNFEPQLLIYSADIDDQMLASEFIHKVRCQYRELSVVTIAISRRQNRALRARNLECGADIFASKSFTYRELISWFSLAAKEKPSLT